MAAPLRSVRAAHFFKISTVKRYIASYPLRWTPSSSAHLQQQQRFLCYSSDEDEKNRKQSKPKLDLAKPGKALAAKERTRQKYEQEMKEKQQKQGVEDEDSINKELEMAVDSIVSNLGEKKEQTKNDLLQKLRKHSVLTESQKKGQPPPKSTFHVGEITDMLYPKGKGRDEGRERGRPREFQQEGSERPPRRFEGRPDGEFRRQRGPRSRHMREDQLQPGGMSELSRLMGSKQPRRTRRGSQKEEVIKLFEGPDLGIFSAADKTKPVEATNPIFDKVEAAQFAEESTLPPPNSWDEAIQWTKEGKLWTFPIDNEQDWAEEDNVGFHEHVFLDHLLDDFPQKGPVRNFMELVVIGLSKNPYLTVQQKHEHVAWFREYFEDKYDMVNELVAEQEAAQKAQKAEAE